MNKQAVDKLERGQSFLDSLSKIAPSESTTTDDQGVGEGLPCIKETDDAMIARLAALPALEYDRCRVIEAKTMGVRPATLDALVKSSRVNDEAPHTPFTEPELWHDPVDPAALLSDLSATIRRFIVLEAEQADAAALWITSTWFVDVAEVAPLAIINAPEKACGKSQLLTVFGRMVHRPLPAANSSAAFLFRAVELWTPTVLIDEADTFVRDNEELKGLVNAGHTRQNAYVGRVVGDSHEPKLFSVWGPKALAGIALEKHLPDSTMSRAIVFNMRRKMPGESVERLRHADAGLFDRLSSKLARFADDYRSAVQAARPSLPEQLDDRSQDNWEPLLAIASCAGSEWLNRATRCALILSGKSDATQSTGNELLQDIQHVFEKKRVSRITTAELIEELLKDDEAAWATYNRGKPIAPRQLSKLLSGYGIKSKNVRMGYEQSKGFEREQFEDVFARYLATPPDLSVPTVPYPANSINTGWDVGRVEKRGTEEKASSVPLEPASNKAWDGGTDKADIFAGEVEL